MSEDYYQSPEPETAALTPEEQAQIPKGSLLDAILNEATKDYVPAPDVFDGMMNRARFEYAFGRALEDWWAASLSVMTRQRRRANARERLMRINEWPKNRDPRSIRRKQVLGSVRTFLQSEAAHG